MKSRHGNTFMVLRVRPQETGHELMPQLENLARRYVVTNQKELVCEIKEFRSSESVRMGDKRSMIAGLYDLEETIGEGHYAVVKLAR